jgi:hypothetical protein
MLSQALKRSIALRSGITEAGSVDRCAQGEQGSASHWRWQVQWKEGIETALSQMTVTSEAADDRVSLRAQGELERQKVTKLM